MLEFNAERHEYTLDGRPLISVTQLMKKHGLAPDYSGIDPTVLARAADRGTLVHKEIENCIKYGDVGFTAEAAAFEQYIIDNGITVKESEYTVYNDICAGTIDLVLVDRCGGLMIADIKTTAALYIDAVSWQLSIYEYLYGFHSVQLLAFHFGRDGELKVVNVPYKPVTEIERLMQCEREGNLYQQAGALDIISPQQVAAIEAAEQIIAQAEADKKAAEDRIASIKSALLAEMEKRALKTVETERVKITYVLPTTRTTIDSARLKKERPEIAEEYSKTSQIGASVRITLKKEE